MPRRTSPIARFAVERRVTMSMAVVGLLVLGAVSLLKLPLEFLPAFSSSSISVSAPYPSSSPEEVERRVVRPLEESLSTINGLETLSASAAADTANLRLSFVDGTDMDLAAVEVRDRIDRVRHRLPDDLERLFVRRFQSSDIPVVRFDLAADWPTERLFDFAENVLARRLERLPGVAQVSVGGVRTPELRVDLDPDRLEAHGLDVRELAERLRSANLNLSAGDVRDGSRKLQVRVVGELASVEEVRRLPLGSGLRLGDVARVSYALPRQEEFNFLNGREALTVSVNKTSTANLLAVADRVKAELEAVATRDDARGLRYTIFQDASIDVRKGLAQLRNAGLAGGGLAILAVFLFLRRVRTTALVAVAIPISVVATFVVMYLLRQAGWSDVTLNVVSLAGLMLALGMLVDNSVVVIESIFRHRSELGKDAASAAIDGTSEVALPILASTVTTLCVFLPLVFIGQGGRMFFYLESIALTVCAVIAASLLVALTVVPMVASLLLRRETARPSRLVEGLTGGYVRALAFTLRHRFAFVVLILALLGGAIYLFTTIERSFSAGSEERQVMLHVDTPRGYSLEQTEALYRELYELLDRHREELDVADVAYAYDRGSGRSRASWRRSRRMEIYLVDEAEGKLTTAEAREKIRALLPTRPGVNLRIAQGRGHSGATGLELELMGDDPVVLELLSRRLAAELARLPMLRDVDTSLESGDEEIHVRVDPARAVQTGLSTQAVAATVARALSSRPVSHFKTGEREVDLVLQFREDERETLEQLERLPVAAPGARLPLGAVATFEPVSGPSSIEREDHRAKVTVSANTTDSAATFAAMRTATGVMESFALPPGYSWSFGRWNRFQQRDQEQSYFSLLFAVVLIYMLMAALFESFLQPLTILFSVPFALLGVAAAMKLASQPFDMMTTIGLIVLLGVVVNNAIVLIDHVNQLRQAGLGRDEAILTGGRHRLRPILITAVTTILGLMPMVAPILFPAWFGPVEGRAGTWAPIGLVILGGLTTSTFLTLMIIPTIYSLVDDAAAWLRRAGREIVRPRAEVEA